MKDVITVKDMGAIVPALVHRGFMPFSPLVNPNKITIFID